jgi:hypothetical protein
VAGRRQTPFSDLLAFGPPLPETERKHIEDEVLPLIRSMREGDASAFKQARKIIHDFVVEDRSASMARSEKLLFLLACRFSTMHLPGYATLDEKHIDSIRDLLESIKLYATDLSRKRPLAFLMLASPGAGKSHFIKCIANELASLKVGAITYNMAGLQAGEDMIPPLDAARNLKVEDKIPLLFLDEFDSSPSYIPMLLPLLWDGEVNIGQRDLKLGKVVIVLAGSDPALPSTMEGARSMRSDEQAASGHSPKMVDLLSRINGGVLRIPPFYDAGFLDRRADKVCVIVHLLRQRFGNNLRDVPLSLLRFTARAEFRYGVRSIANLVGMIPHNEEVTSLRVSDLELPLNNATDLKNSPLAYHLLHEDQAFGIEALWKAARADDGQMPVRTDLITTDLITPTFPSFDDNFLLFAIGNTLRLLDEANGGESKRASGAKSASSKTTQRSSPPKRSRQGKAKA